ncbi:MFS transporter [Rhodococcus sp. H29-C3]|uniref:MFS transporter n=1 Tax=Rhodococcus sp. H29-C3 TaxID=3046307 RepID=UPI0024BA7E1F|nr:MFS transporter [Rhodococcus sp. H29-C3]MDJ0363057.1 MFS transporter [Rhodococcus sp. H29-C3]
MSSNLLAPDATQAAVDPRRWIALIVIATSTLMVVLDAPIMNIALPHAQSALSITDADRHWIITAYTLSFGGLLLLGGRVADVLGRKRMFVIGLLGFAVPSWLPSDWSHLSTASPRRVRTAPAGSLFRRWFPWPSASLR